MNNLTSRQLPITFHPLSGVIEAPLQFGSNAELVTEQRTGLEQLLKGAKLPSDAHRFVLSPLSSKRSVHTTPIEPDLPQRVFDAGVEMKVSVAQYAMHLSPETRTKLFKDLDDVVNSNDWYEEDPLPRLESFRDFLKWTIYSRRHNWISVGFSDEGNILVAWKSQQTMLTANFRGNFRVLWTATRTSDDGDTYAAGESTLQFFEREARLYLE